MKCYLLTATDYDPYESPRTYHVGIASDLENLKTLLENIQKTNPHITDYSRFSTELKVYHTDMNTFKGLYNDMDDDLVPMNEIKEMLKATKKIKKNAP